MLIGGFRTTFTFRLSNVAAGAGLEGLAFVVATGTQAVGGSLGGLGYADASPTGTGGLPYSFAVEIDSYSNSEMSDPPYPHFSVHSNGAAPNTALEYSASMLCEPIGLVLPFVTNASAPYTMTILYEPPYAWNPTGSATLSIFVAGIVPPVGVCSVPLLGNLVGASEPGGTANIMFTASGGPTPSDVQDLLAWSYVYLGYSNANTSQASGPGLVGCVAGASCSFVVQAYDQYGAPYLVDGDTVTGVAASQVFNAVSLGNGSYELTYSLTRAGPTSMTVLLNNAAIAGSPFTLSISPAAIDPPSCTFAVLNGGQAAVWYNVSISLFDRFGNAVDQTGVPMQLQFTPKAYPMGVHFAYVSGNQYSCTFFIEHANSYVMGMLIENVAVGMTRDITVHPGPFDPANSLFTGAGLTGAVAGVLAELVVSLFDAYGNAIHYGPASVTAQMTEDSPGPAAFDVVNQANGNYSVSYLATKAGTYGLRVFVGPGTEPVGLFSPVVLSTNIPVPAYTRMYGDGYRGEYVAGVQQQFRFAARDQYNNTLVNSDNVVSVAVLLESVQGTRFATSVPNQEVPLIVYNVTYTLTLAQSYLLSVFMNDQPAGGPFDIVILPGAVDPVASVARSLSGGALSSVLTDERNYFSIEFVDEYGNGLGSSTGMNVTTYLMQGSRTFSVSVSESEDGTVKCSYVLNRMGAYYLYVLVNNVAIRGSPFRVNVSWRWTLTVVVCSLLALMLIVIAVFVIVVLRRKRTRRRYVRL